MLKRVIAVCCRRRGDRSLEGYVELIDEETEFLGIEGYQFLLPQSEMRVRSEVKRSAASCLEPCKSCRVVPFIYHFVGETILPGIFAESESV